MSEHLVTLEPRWIEASLDYGRRSVAGYASGRKTTRQSFGGIEKDPLAQSQAKMAECAFAVWAGLDPATAVDWGEVPDQGYDVAYWRALVNVKALLPYRRLLLWPYTKVDDYWNKNFTALVAVRVMEPQFEILKWIDKLAFYERHHVAGEGEKLHVGTWWMDLDELFPIESLMAYYGMRVWHAAGRHPTAHAPADRRAGGAGGADPADAGS